jgi:hypothetical protein
MMVSTRFVTFAGEETTELMEDGCAGRGRERQ